jgi:hypothetical protein
MRALPEGVNLATDVSVARWVVDGIQSWGRGRVPVTSVVPQGFDAYVRIPHPGQKEPIGEGPPEDVLATLIELLSGYTATPDSCWLCIWSGYGFWSSGAYKLLVLGDPEGTLEKEFSRVMRDREQLVDGVPEVDIGGGRSYFLFHGPISAAGSMAFDFDGAQQPPNMWWPDDRAWCVASDIDLPSTYVGGSRGCIDRLIRAPELNAAEVAPEDDVSGGISS